MNFHSDLADTPQGDRSQDLPVSKACELLLQRVAPVQGTENIHLSSALGRILAQEIISPIHVPAHDNSAADGFAFAGDVLSTAQSVTLKLVGTVQAGQTWPNRIQAGQCIKIMTGAILPTGADTVAPQEICRVFEETVHLAANALKSGDNRRLKGEDLRAGSVALSQGKPLKAAALGLLASLNISQVQVYRKLKVAYFSTGNELLSLGDAPREGAIYDSNRYSVTGLLKHWGCEVIDMGIVHDDEASIEAAFHAAASQADAIITTGGVSVGEADLTQSTMRKLGHSAVWRIAMRPGRTMVVGRMLAAHPETHKSGFSGLRSSPAHDQTTLFSPQGCILLGLPGNPVAAMVTLLAIVRPAIMRMSGAAMIHSEGPVLLKAQSLQNLRKLPGRTEFQRGIVSRSANGALQVCLSSAHQGSGVLSSMVAANGLIVLHDAQGQVNAGDPVDVMMFEGVM
jgi:molybdopterin molybdotransferase